MLILSLCCVYSIISNYWDLLNCVYPVWRVTSCKSKSCPKRGEEFHAKPNERSSHTNFCASHHSYHTAGLCKAVPLRLSEELQHGVCQLVRGAKGQTGCSWYQATPSVSFAWEMMPKSTPSSIRHTWDAGGEGEREEKEPIQGETLFRAQLLQATVEPASFVPPCTIFMVTSVWLSGQANA